MSDRMKNKAAREEMAKPQAVRSSFIVRRSSLHSAFSMIEIMVAIVIIAILAAIAMVAYKGVVGGNQNNQTKAMLGSLRGMLIEYENATHFQNAPPLWEWKVSRGGGAVVSVIQPSSGTTPDFWMWPANNTSVVPAFADPLVAPTLVTPGMPDRVGSIGILNTQLAMGMIASLPVNQAVMQKMPTKSTEFLQFVSGTSPIYYTNGGLTNTATGTTRLITNLPPNAGLGICWYSPISASVGSFYTNAGQGGMSKASVEYVNGIQIEVTDAHQNHYFFTYHGAALSNPVDLASMAASNNLTETTQSSWIPTPNITPLVLDAWGNPIIFVPGSGLIVYSKAGGHSDATKGYIYQVVLIQSPDHKPFFASAGPDGDFSNGDDNIYSFEE